MPKIKITYDEESYKRITKDEQNELKDLFVANANEVVKTDPNLSFKDGPTQSPIAPDEVVVENSPGDDKGGSNDRSGRR